MGVRLLGPLEVDGADQISPRDRVVLATLALRAADTVPADQLADALWGEDPPVSWPKVVQGCVARLRRILGRGAIETTTAGYRLTLGDEEIDARRFEALASRGNALVGLGEPDRAAAVLHEALGLWRGTALPDLDRWPDGRTAATRLEELRAGAQESLLLARAALGDNVVADATALVRAAPLRETRWHALAVALYRAGRQSDALGALRQARRTLQDELGLDPGQELVDLEHAILTHQPSLDAPPRQARDAGVCPYQGLLVYDRGDSERFFGRGDETAACVRILRDFDVLVVTGPSGCGKSSLVRAGVVPALERAGERVIVCTPGSDPTASLSAAQSVPGTVPVLVVDQLEELFTSHHETDVVRSFLETLARRVAAGRPVVIVVRGDQLGGFAVAADAARLVERSLHLLAQMAEAELREAIEQPAIGAGLRLEPGLVELLVRDTEGEPGALPLLSHALAETWRRREGSVLTVAGYRASGGIRGAVAQSAESLWESLPSRQRAAVRSLLLRLVTVSDDAEPTATRLPLASLGADPDRGRALDLLLHSRLVTVDGSSVTVAHEAVIRAWPRLRSWLDTDAAGRLMFRHLTVAADDWTAAGRPNSELYRGVRLEAALNWRADSSPELTTVESDFLDASMALTEAEREAAEGHARVRVRANRRLKTALVATAVGLVLAMVAGLFAVQQSRQAAQTARAALVDELVAQSVALRSTRRDLAALLAVEAHRLDQQASTRGALFGVLTATPGFDGYLPTGPNGDRMPLTSGRMLADGRTVLATGIDGVIREYDVRTGYSGRSFPPPVLAPIDARLDVSRDQTTVAEVSWEGPPDHGGRATLSVFDLPNRRRRVPDVRLPLDVGAVAVSPDGRYVAVSGYNDGHVLVFETLGRDRLPELSTVDAAAPGVVGLPTVGSAPDFESVRQTAALAFRPDGRLLVGSEVGIVRLVDPGTGREVGRFVGAPPLTSNNQFALSDDGRVMLSAGSRGVVRWDLGTRRRMWAVPLGEDRCRSVAVLSGSLLCGGRYARVESFDLRNGNPTPGRYDMQRGQVSALLVTPDRKTLVELSDTDAVIARWQLDGTGPVTSRLPVPGTPSGYSADGRLLVTSGPQTYTGRLGDVRQIARVVDARTGAVVRRLGAEQVRPVWTGRPGQLAVWTEGGRGHVIDARSGHRLLRLDSGFGDPPAGGQATPGGRYLLAWGQGEAEGGGTARSVWAIWDLRTGRTTGSALTSSGRSGSTTTNGRLVLWNTDGELLSYSSSGRWLAARAGVFIAAVSPDGVVAASTRDGRLRFLRPRDLQPAGPAVPGSTGRLKQLSFSSDGALLAALGDDGGVRLVDLAAHVQLGEPVEADLQDGSEIALRPDGRALAVPSPQGLLVWDLRPGRWRAAVCQVAGRDLTGEEWDTYLYALGDYRRTCS